MRVLIALCLAFALLPETVAAGCETSTTTPLLDTGETAAGQHYVVADDCSWWCVTGYMFWVYEESNGIPGLQRGDENVDDTCGGAIRADTVVL